MRGKGRRPRCGSRERRCGCEEITSIIRPGNAGSIHVAESLGAVAGETVEFYGAPSVLYRYPRMK